MKKSAISSFTIVLVLAAFAFMLRAQVAHSDARMHELAASLH